MSVRLLIPFIFLIFSVAIWYIRLCLGYMLPLLRQPWYIYQSNVSGRLSSGWLKRSGSQTVSRGRGTWFCARPTVNRGLELLLLGVASSPLLFEYQGIPTMCLVRILMSPGQGPGLSGSVFLGQASVLCFLETISCSTNMNNMNSQKVK